MTDVESGTHAAMQATYSMRTRNPDVLTCIANLSSDEVFTPPEFANKMLDTLADGWADANDGADIWADSALTYLDPFAKSGIFLREITKRLVHGLRSEFPDLRERVDHILTKQVFGIGITEICAQLARRSLYCSKDATGPHSIAKSLEHPHGNIWFERTEHTWVGGHNWVYTADAQGNQVKRFTDGRCSFCGTPQSTLDRGSEAESHAYAFTHTNDIKQRMAEIFGANMQFDVVIGNPPYQLQSDGGTRDVPIYQHFVEQAKKLEPRYLSMVTPSRWMAGGLGLNAYRDSMLSDQRIRRLIDYSRMETVFPGVDFEGGASYFLWDRDHPGPCESTYHLGEEAGIASIRTLDEFDIFVRDARSVSILHKVLLRGEVSMVETMASNNEFGLVTNFSGFKSQQSETYSLAVHVIKDKRRVVGWMRPGALPKGKTFVDRWKVLIPKSYGERGAIPANILGPLLIAQPPSVSTQTYVFVDVENEAEALAVAAYARTKFFRFMLSLRKITQHASLPVYQWVPQQTWDRHWTDEELFDKYDLSQEERAFVERVIRTMKTAGDV